MGEVREELEASWRALARERGWSEDAREVFEDLVRRYAAPERYYHNLEHLQAVLRSVAALRQLVRQPTALALAAWFHDAVYDSTAPDNEERSAALAEVCLRERGETPEFIAEVVRLILLTKHHTVAPEDVDGAHLLDADLAILAAPREVYDRYAAAIRREYAWVPEADYRAGRLAVLRRFLDRPTVYQRRDTAERHEAAARANLAHEIRCLESGAVPRPAPV